MNYLLIALVALMGSFTQAVTGFGYAIICMALWPLILPLRVASVLEVMTAFVMVIYISLKLCQHINFRLMIWPLLSYSVASAVGVFTLLSGTETVIRRILGVILVLLSIYFKCFSNKVRIKPTRRNGLLAGLVSGFLSGLFNIGGPPMVVYFLSVTEDKMEYNATLQCYFTFTTIYVFLLHLFMGNVNIEVLQYSVAGLAGLAVGTGTGLCLLRRLSMEATKKFVYGFMILAGIYLVIAG